MSMNTGNRCKTRQALPGYAKAVKLGKKRQDKRNAKSIAGIPSDRKPKTRRKDANGNWVVKGRTPKKMK